MNVPIVANAVEIESRPAVLRSTLNAQVIANFTGRRLRRQLEIFLNLSIAQRDALFTLWNHGKLTRTRNNWEAPGCTATHKTVSWLCEHGLAKMVIERKRRITVFAELHHPGIMLMRAVDEFNSIQFHNIAEIGANI